jgi:hypothetical protein
MPIKKSFFLIFSQMANASPKATLGQPLDQTGSGPNQRAPRQPWPDKIQRPIFHGCFMAKANLLISIVYLNLLNTTAPKILLQKLLSR